MRILDDYLRDVSPAIDFNQDHLKALLAPGNHSAHLAHHRATVIIARIQLVALIMAAVSLGLAIYAGIVLPGEASMIVAGHIVSGLAFLFLCWPWNAVRTLWVANAMLALMLAIGALFWVGAISILRPLELSGEAFILAGVYEILPFVVIVSLSIFPLTFLENLLQSMPTVLLTFVVYILMPDFMLDVDFSRMLLLIFLLAVAMLAGMGQLHYIVKLVNRLALDADTGAHTRSSGKEALDVSFRLSELQRGYCAIAFVGLGDIEKQAEKLGPAGTLALMKEAAGNLRKFLRNGDQLVRWDDWRFLILLGNANAKGVNICMNRILKEGFARTADGQLIVGNVGVAERQADNAEAIDELIDIAEDRLLQAADLGLGLCLTWKGNTIKIGSDVV